MHLVLLHGYLLTGTGSNIYVANVARAWATQGHAVTVVCQEHEAASLSFVNEAFFPGDDLPKEPPADGRLRVVVPDIGGLLPVYVFDRYEGYEVKCIPDMTPEEVERHIALTARALRQAARKAHRVLANHVLLGPVIARRALTGTGVPYDVKLHGSAIEYTLVPTPRLMPYAIEGLKSAERIYAGTRYVRDRVLEVFDAEREDLGLDEKVHVVSPGMDPTVFTLSEDPAASERRALETIATKIRRNGGGRRAGAGVKPGKHTDKELHELLVSAGETYDQRTPDADLLERWPELRPDEPVIGYLGKLLDTKGVGELLVTFPKVAERIPQSRLLIIGFGAYREHLEGMAQSLQHGDLDAFTRYARAGGFVEELDFRPWFRPLGKRGRDRITLTGMLDHDCLRDTLPLCSLLTVPSKWPEAFGMAAVEAMAAGVLPLCNYHGGLKDVVDEVATVAPELAELMKLGRSRFVHELPDRICSALEFLYPKSFAEHEHRRNVAKTLRKIAVERFSWDGIAVRLLNPT